MAQVDDAATGPKGKKPKGGGGGWFNLANTVRACALRHARP